MSNKHTASYIGHVSDVEKEVDQWIENGGQVDFHSDTDHQGNTNDHYHLWTEDDNSDRSESIVINIDDTETISEGEGLYEIED